MNLDQPEDVFVTDGYPEHTYVSIDSGQPERDLSDGLGQRNKIISIAGPSKSGKSTLCEKAFGRAAGVDKLYVTGDAVQKGDDLWLQVYKQASDQTSPNYFELPYNEVLSALIERDLPLVVDDFHYINREVQVILCRQFKNAASAGLRIIVLSTPHRGDDPIRSNPDLSGRIFTVDFRFWREDDLAKIAELGFYKIGVPIVADFNTKLAYQALRSPQIMQTLCLEVARLLPKDLPMEHADLSGIDLNEVKKRALRSYNMETPYHLLLSGPAERGSKRLDYQLANGFEGDVYQILTLILQQDPPFHQLSLDDIKQRMRSFLADEREPNIRGALQQIAGIFKDGNPPLEWDDEKRQLTVVDPHFYFYLRNTSHAVASQPSNSGELKSTPDAQGLTAKQQNLELGGRD